MKIVVGGGPAGIYAAIKLRKKGIRDVVICDPRAGNYTRPGHLNASVFETAKEGLKKDFWPDNTVGHIRDLEKILYKEAQSLGIPIEKKRFLRMHKDPKKPGVVVQNERGDEEIIEADYVFDCTGAKREVIKAVNEETSDSPFQLVSIIEPPVTNHLLAYVKVSASDWARFQMNRDRVYDTPDTIEPLTFARSMIELRKLGWKEFKIPQCYGRQFGKQKTCIYFHAPDGLAKEDYDKWVQAVLDCYAKPIQYEQIIASRQKPYFLTFPMQAQALKDVSYKGENLPTVIALGDAQIDFDYVLAHGIKDGLERINILFKHMEIVNHEIYYFDSKEYLQSVQKALTDHKRQMIRSANQLKESFIDVLDIAERKLTEAQQLTQDIPEKLAISEMLKEIQARQHYEKGRKLFAVYHSQSNHVLLEKYSLETLIANLNQIHSHLIEAHNNLPTSFSKERQIIEGLLAHLAISFKEVGNSYFKKKNLSQANDAYRKALEILDLDYLSSANNTKKIPIYSNLIITNLQNKQYKEAIRLANEALQVLRKESIEESSLNTLHEKIAFNLIKACCLQAQDLLPISQVEAKNFYLEAKMVLEREYQFLSSTVLKSADELINSLEKQLLIQGSATPSTSNGILMNFSMFNTDSQDTEKKEYQLGYQVG
ncbi:FAD binding domain [Legionella busanensis]|uniref:FAD binding domain n=1 Tax=Legionella busanensis TaxID=190655 RepID=A0A378JN76_9GAMM|nr:FAD-dependent monooxygenase [Legionella busanensis]STX51460.1 FAD binding domain [Legionella busanensis]